MARECGPPSWILREAICSMGFEWALLEFARLHLGGPHSRAMTLGFIEHGL
jgi:hypothetical protein